MMLLAAFAAGCFIGGFFGILIMALCMMAKIGDVEE